MAIFKSREEIVNISLPYKLRIESTTGQTIRDGMTAVLSAKVYNTDTKQDEPASKFTYTWQRNEKPTEFTDKQGDTISITYADTVGGNATFTCIATSAEWSGTAYIMMSENAPGWSTARLILYKASKEPGMYDGDDIEYTFSTGEYKPQGTLGTWSTTQPADTNLPIYAIYNNVQSQTETAIARKSNWTSPDKISADSAKTLKIISPTAVFDTSSRGYVTADRIIKLQCKVDNIDFKDKPVSWTVLPTDKYIDTTSEGMGASNNGEFFTFKILRKYDGRNIDIAAQIDSEGLFDKVTIVKNAPIDNPVNLGTLEFKPNNDNVANDPFVIPNVGPIGNFDHFVFRQSGGKDEKGEDLFLCTSYYFKRKSPNSYAGDWFIIDDIDTDPDYKALENNDLKFKIAQDARQEILNNPNTKYSGEFMNLYVENATANYIATTTLDSSDIQLITHTSDKGEKRVGKLRTAGYIPVIDPNKKKGKFYADAEGNVFAENINVNKGEFTDIDVSGRLTSQSMSTKDKIHSHMNGYRPPASEFGVKKLSDGKNYHSYAVIHKGKMYFQLFSDGDYVLLEYDPTSQNTMKYTKIDLKIPSAYEIVGVYSTGSKLCILLVKLYIATYYTGWCWGNDVNSLAFYEPVTSRSITGENDRRFDESLRKGSIFYHAYVVENELYALVKFYELYDALSKTYGPSLVFIRITPYVETNHEVPKEEQFEYLERSHYFIGGIWGNSGSNPSKYVFSFKQYDKKGNSPYLYCGNSLNLPIFFGTDYVKVLDFSDSDYPNRSVNGVFPCKRKMRNGSYYNFIYVVTTTMYSDGPVDTLFEVDTSGWKTPIPVTDSVNQRILDVTWNDKLQTPEVWVWDVWYKSMMVNRLDQQDNEYFYGEYLAMSNLIPENDIEYFLRLSNIVVDRSGSEQYGLAFPGGMFIFGYLPNRPIFDIDTRYGHPFKYTLTANGDMYTTQSLIAQKSISSITCDSDRLLILFSNGNRLLFYKDKFYPYFNFGRLNILDKPAANIVSDIIPDSDRTRSVGTPAFRIEDIFAINALLGNIVFDLSFLPNSSTGISKGRVYVTSDGTLKVKLTD